MSDVSTKPGPGGTFNLAGRPAARVGYGMGQLTRQAQSPEGYSAAITLLRHALDLGINHFDTAQFYGNGLANRLIRDALGGRRNEYLIATKAGAMPVPGAPVPLTAAQKPGELRAAVEANLATLGTDWLDVVNLRRMDYLPGLLAEENQIVPLEDQLAEMSALRDEGKIRGIGLSHVTAEQLRIALPAGITCVQNIYNMLDRSFEPLLDDCRAKDIAWVPYFPLGGGGGYAGLPKVIDNPTVRDVAERLGVTPTQIGLAWQLAHSPNTMLIPGTSSIAHLTENVAAGAITLDPDTMNTLNTVAMIRTTPPC
ncbi:MAG: aldo/keto reductase [Chloroflexota bacterium]|nr:aldo/keto reductase [Chloroflexota bacterium]